WTLRHVWLPAAAGRVAQCRFRRLWKRHHRHRRPGGQRRVWLWRALRGEGQRAVTFRAERYRLRRRRADGACALGGPGRQLERATGSTVTVRQRPACDTQDPPGQGGPEPDVARRREQDLVVMAEP